MAILAFSGRVAAIRVSAIGKPGNRYRTGAVLVRTDAALVRTPAQRRPARVGRRTKLYRLQGQNCTGTHQFTRQLTSYTSLTYMNYYDEEPLNTLANQRMNHYDEHRMNYYAEHRE